MLPGGGTGKSCCMESPYYGCGGASERMIPIMKNNSEFRPFMHFCTVREGPLEGNKVIHEVTTWEIEYNEKCEHCGETLSPIREILAHIYEHLSTSK
jgi:hypothetical protein